ncbi:MAG: 50S ribosomal protein L9 [Acidimicrobiia bacterium]|nr:50S ribosomal protein L9 [Acidimicrobiia bacterium]
MKVILTKDVQDLGAKGDIVDVADGYARNYLVPKSFAVAATEGALRQAEGMRRAREEAARKARADADAMAQSLVGARVVVAARAGDEGKLFGSIGTADIAAAIKKFTGVEVERGHIKPMAPIKEIGLHEVGLQPHPDVEFDVTLDVIPA